MKKTFIGAVITLISTAWLILFAFVILTNPVSYVEVSGWLITNLKAKRLILPTLFFLATFIWGAVILCIEYFNKEE